jgi:non-ribosomal peptide synthetase-like protein
MDSGLREAEAPPVLSFRAQVAPRVEPAPLSILNDADMLRWRHGECLDHVLEETCRRHADRIAVAIEGADVTYREFDARANQMARYFLRQGVTAGDRIAVLADRGLDSYVALFALLKVRATYVPLDANHPPERLRYIMADAGVSRVVTHLRLADRFAESSIPRIVLDRSRYEIADLDDAPLGEDERGAATDALCYVLYTSGTTGQPKGVAVAHPSICNFVRVAAELYGFAPGDRVYQGMSIAFDFSVEELWVPLVAGATLTPNTSATSLFGDELAEFLESRRVTCFCCVPTLLASIDRELPNLRILLVGGEACPPALVKRWSREGRARLNSYGPTEATVTATLGRMSPDRPVTIGRPLPTYAIVILDPKRGEALEMGEAGEIGIAGIGVAEGYLNRRELTEAKFIPDFLALPNNPSGRIYRTGDLGRINGDGEIEYLGRIDTQVKLRGYRIELTEIESVLLEVPDIAQVVVTTFEPTPGAPELVAYYAVKHGAPAPAPAILVAALRARLPAYMTPAYLERLPFIPTLVSNKADREKLPAPKTPRLRFSVSATPPTSPTELALCRALAETLNLDEVSIDGDFFDEYGAHSLLMARFCAKIRQNAPAIHVAMRDIYTYPTVRRLARALDAAKPIETVEPDAAPDHEVSDLAHFVCGAAQCAFYVVAAVIGVALAQASFGWTYAVVDAPITLYLRAVVVSAAWFLALNALAVAGKWALIGRARPGFIPLWSAAYFRFWAARQLVGLAPANLFVGTPLYNVFLRCLGARIGRHALIATGSYPIAADLLSVGDDAVIARRALLPGTSAFGNRLHFDEIRVGKGAYVGEASVLDIGAAIGDFGQLGHASSLRRGQNVPEGKRCHGSPAEETTTNFRRGDELATPRPRRVVFTICQLALALAVAGPATDALLTYLFAFWIADAKTDAPSALGLLPSALLMSLGLFAASLFIGLVAVNVVPRCANAFLREGRVYPLYGFHHFLQRVVEGFSNSTFFNLLFGDSVFIERYLRHVGLRLAPSRATGSNFGTEQSYQNPFLCSIGAGTVASDGLTLGNVTISSHAFRLGACRVGANTFIGTDVFVPPGARIGENCMLGTKVMAPIDGPIRENVGLLGSPSFEIPRAASRDLELVGRVDAAERQRRLKLKTRHNIVTGLAMLTMHWFVEFEALFVMTLAAEFYGWRNLPAMSIALGVVLALAVATHVLVERASTGFGRLKPQVATTYDPAFWRVERYWKLSGAGSAATLFAGTPLRPWVLRALGVRVGRKVFDDGVNISERALVEIGDGANINLGVMLQAHSLEEGVFKSDHIRVGAGVALGVGAFAHYGVVLREGTYLDADAFLMKGEITPAYSRWRGNPAKLVGRRARPARS